MCCICYKKCRLCLINTVFLILAVRTLNCTFQLHEMSIVDFNSKIQLLLLKPVFWSKWDLKCRSWLINQFGRLWAVKAKTSTCEPLQSSILHQKHSLDYYKLYRFETHMYHEKSIMVKKQFWLLQSVRTWNCTFQLNGMSNVYFASKTQFFPLKALPDSKIHILKLL